MTFGATPQDWAHWQKLGIESDLLPYVADPSTKPSEQSKVKEPGKVPSRFNNAGEMVGFPGWTSHIATDKNVARWANDSRLGLCIIARQVKAIDVDIADPVQAARVREFIEMGLGALPMRRRPNSGKFLLALKLPVAFPKRIIKTAHGNIELLSEKQQFLAVGMHPSGVRYEWVDTDGVIGLPAEVPEITMAELDNVWEALIAAFALPDGAATERNGVMPTKARRSEDMQDPRVLYLDENGWVLDYQRDGRVDIDCPFGDGHTPGSGGSTSTSYFPAGVGGFAQGHYRCLHASCAGRSDADYDEAIGYGANDFDVIETLANAKGEVAKALPAFTRARNGQIEATVGNVLMALRRPDVCGMQIGFDTFKDVRMCGVGGVWRPFGDQDYMTLRETLERGSNGFKPIGRELVRDSVKAIAYQHRFDSAIQWGESLQWDGVERVGNFWSRYFGVTDTPYSRAVSRYTWTAFAGRCLTPGEKCDMVPVLIGLQGAGKTSMIKALAPTPDAFAGINLEKKDEDIARGIRGKLVCELAELRGLASREAEAIKDWISREFEEWVPKYDEFSTRYGRRFLGIGTGNRDGFLDDETGERRWLPMHVGLIDTEAIKADRDQLWAEGVHLYKTVGVAWQDAYSLASAEHHKFKVGDVWCEEIEAWLARDDMDGPRDPSMVRMRDVLIGAIGLQLRQITRREELRAGKALLMLGFSKRVVRLGGVNTKVWTRETTGNSPFDDLA